jgi:hypothetical protein
VERFDPAIDIHGHSSALVTAILPAAQVDVGARRTRSRIHNRSRQVGHGVVNG